MQRTSSVALAIVALVVLASSGLSVAVLASHEPSSTDYVVDPSDPAPEAGSVTYVHEVDLTDNFGGGRSGFETVTSAEFSISDADVSGCSGGLGGIGQDFTLTVTEGSSQEEFDSYDGSFSGGTASFDIDDASRDYKSGETLRLELGGCVTNPGSAGWYQAELTVEGTAFGSDEVITLDATSHYFYICNCSDEQEARDELGAPPSEPTPTATATPTPTPTATATPTATPTDPPADDPTPTPTQPDDEPTPTPTESQDGDDPTPTRSPTATDTETGGEFFGMDPMLVVAIVAAVSIGLAAFGATRL